MLHVKLAGWNYPNLHHITPQTWKLQPKTWQGSQLWSITAVNTNTPGPCRYVGCTGICWELEAFWQVCVGYSPSIKQSIKSIVCFCEWWHLLRTIHWLWLGSIKIYVSVSGSITVVVIALVAVFNLIYTTYFNFIDINIIIIYIYLISFLLPTTSKWMLMLLAS